MDFAYLTSHDMPNGSMSSPPATIFDVTLHRFVIHGPAVGSNWCTFDNKWNKIVGIV